MKKLCTILLLSFCINQLYAQSDVYVITSNNTGLVRAFANGDEAYSIVDIDSTGRLKFSDGSNIHDVYIYRSGSNALKVSSDGGSGKADFEVTGNLNADTSYFIAIGINEASPYYHLTVADSTGINGPTLGLKRNDPVVNNNNRIGRIAIMGGETNPDIIVGSIVVNAETNWSVNSSPTRLEFRTTPAGSTGDTERMRIDESGNVGIGTTSATSKLEVNGDIEIPNSANGIILTAPDAGCWRVTVDNAGTLVTTSITCP